MGGVAYTAPSGRMSIATTKSIASGAAVRVTARVASMRQTGVIDTDRERTRAFGAAPRPMGAVASTALLAATRSEKFAFAIWEFRSWGVFALSA